MLGHVARVLARRARRRRLRSDERAQRLRRRRRTASLAALYAEALQAIRAAEREAGSPPRLIFFEPSALWSLTGHRRRRPTSRATATSSTRRTSTPAASAPAAERRARSRWRATRPRASAAHPFSAASGAAIRAARPIRPTRYFLDHQNLQDQFFFGATLWTWHESCGDPHKQADYRAGRLPYVWGEFEVDCTTNAITGVRQDLIDQLTRAYVRAAPGRLVEGGYDYASGAFTARGTAATAGQELLVFYPASRHGEPTLTTSGLSNPQVILAPGDNLYLVARATGGDWSLAAQ